LGSGLYCRRVPCQHPALFYSLKLLTTAFKI